MMPLFDGWSAIPGGGSGKPGHCHLLLDRAGLQAASGGNVIDFPGVDWRPLYANTKFVNYMVASPVLAHLKPDSFLMRWYTAEPANWRHGLVLFSTASDRALLVHLRSLLTTTLYGRREALFRFYNPELLDVCAPTFTGPDRERLLGPALEWRWITGDRDWNRLRRDDMGPPLLEYGEKPNEAQAKEFILSPATLKAYTSYKDRRFLEKMHAYFAEQNLRIPEERFYPVAEEAVAQGRAYSLTYETSLSLFTLFWFTAPGFHLRPENRKIFEDPAMPELEKIELVSDAMQHAAMRA